MNSIWIILIVGVWFLFSYRFYGRFIEKKLKINDKRKTPSVTRKNNVDFSPSKKPFLIGHHFASIAGAGPIIGPILAISYFGWLPVVLWIALGSVFIGAMHDFTSLMASVRNRAEGVSNIAKKSLNSRSGFLFGIMIFITLILIITVFSVSAAESIVNVPSLIIPLLTITFVAIILGLGVEKYHWNYKISSAIAIAIIFLSVWIGATYPFALSFVNENLLKIILITIILLYAGIASIVPVWALLRPRDYLSAIQMSFILFLGILGILIVQPLINAPQYISNPIFPLWPILFITVACGAVSGFHGLVASGTTSKQLSKESHGKSVGYGSMLGEATLATLVTIVAIAGLKWGNISGGFQAELSKGWIVLFSSGYGNIVGNMGIPLITVGIASLLGAFMVNQFILTSVDTSTRLNRFIISETLIPKIKDKKILITILILIPVWLLAVTNSYETLWRLFGTSNQLTAAITMIAISSYFISKKISVKFIVIPALFVLVTTMSALIYLTFSANGYIFSGNYILAITSIGMFVLGLIVAKEGFDHLRKNRK
jgi:carbon starvation protein|tara:strand:+ start:9 stop:1640 length:1632 start_codon:yes stop_codon:yes gene_type:complete